MDTLLSSLPTGALQWGGIIIGVIIIVIFLMRCIRVVSGNEVLVVTGVGATKKCSVEVADMEGKKEIQISYQPKIRIAGASFVWPFIQKAKKFDVCMEKVEKSNDTMKTKTGVEIVIDWGISYAPNADTVETLQPAIRQFLDKDKKEVQDIIQSVVAGGLRAVISTMAPLEVMVGKETLDEAVQKNIAEQMAGLGYKVQIYIQEVRDAENSTYYHDLAAEDREGTRKKAAVIKATADQAIREKEAETEKIARQAEIDKDVAIAEKDRDAAVQKASFKIETDKAQADAEVAGKLQAAERDRELAEKQGQVEVMKQQQGDAAAKAEQAKKVTEAETKKKEKVIESEAEAESRKVAADAEAAVVKIEATGKAEAKRLEAEGDADATKKRAEGEAEKIKVTGLAEAEATRAKGKAEADAIEAKGKAEAEAARALSDAQAANDRVNYEITKLEIQRDTQIQVANSVAAVMAKIGENATFYDFGGSSHGSGKGNLLTNVMSEIPQLFAKTNLENLAVNGENLTDTVKQLVSAIADPIHGSQAEEPSATPSEPAVVTGYDETEDVDTEPTDDVTSDAEDGIEGMSESTEEET